MNISIIIPVYNVERYIEACLDSVVAQTMKDGVECILVDDRGTDNSLSIIDGYFKNNGCVISADESCICNGMEFRILHHDMNRGLSAARNTGITAAKGRYLYFLDSDDELTANCLDEMWKLVGKFGEIDLIQGSYTEIPSYINQTAKRPFEGYTDNQKLAKACLLSYDINPITAQNRLVRRQMVIDNKIYFKEGIIHEDNHWTFFLAKYVRKMAICETPTYLHRYNPDSITHNRNLEKEIFAYGVIIRDFVANIDNVLRGNQKILILNTLVIAMNAGFYNDVDDKHELIGSFMNINSCFERFLLRTYFKTKNPKLLHLLFKVYKLEG